MTSQIAASSAITPAEKAQARMMSTAGSASVSRGNSHSMLSSVSSGPSGSSRDERTWSTCSTRYCDGRLVM